MSIDSRIMGALWRSVLAGAGSTERPIDAGANPYEFVLKHEIKLDRQAFDFGPRGYSHLVEPFQSDANFLTVMAGAQAGKTGLAMARVVWAMAGGARGDLWGALHGWYFPIKDLAKDFSNSRFAPFIRSNDQLRPWVGRDTTEGKGQDAVRSRTLGPSRIYFLGADGKASTESFPFRSVTLDEVRRMSYHHVQLIEERLSGQADPWMTRVSTANYPKSDIHLYFLRGDQHHFHSACGCPDGCVLSLLGDAAVLDLRHATPAIKNKAAHAFHQAGLPYLGIWPQDRERYARWHAAYWCPKCGEIIVNPRDGWWEPHAPQHWERSYQLSQMLSPRFPAAGILSKIARTDEPVNVQEVWNSVYGLPYLDPRAQPVTEDHLLASVRSDLVWPIHLPRKDRLDLYPTICAGVDVQAGYLVAVLKARAEGGKSRTIHLQILEGEDPWRELARMVIEWNVRCTVIDAQPEANAARSFCKTFPARAFMAYYVEGDTERPLIAWHDVSKERAQRGEERFRYSVTIHRSPALEWSLKRWAAGLNECPPERGLVQELPVDGKGAPVLHAWLKGQRGFVPICRELYWLHLQRVVFEDQRDDHESARLGKPPERRAVHVGLDPHFAHANLYADVALSRFGR